MNGLRSVFVTALALTFVSIFVFHKNYARITFPLLTDTEITFGLDHDTATYGTTLESLPKKDQGDGVGTIYFGDATTNANDLRRGGISASELGTPHDGLWKLTDHQKSLLDDTNIVPELEMARCARYNFDYDPNRATRRRIFWGGPLTDESLGLLQTIAVETWDLYHTAAFVESNTTHMVSPREWRFPPQSHRREVLQTLFAGSNGDTTKVSVDYFVVGEDPPREGFHNQHVQRQAVLERWKRNGMQPDDLGFLSDCDEVFSRDFLRALQICNVPEFRPGQDCHKPKIVATGMIFEASPECVIENAMIWHPDIIIGECVDLIGNDTLHKDPEREWKGTHSYRAVGHGKRDEGDYETYTANISQNNGMYPLWNAADFRGVAGGRQIQLDRKLVHHTAYHFHNFFETTTEIRQKYATYGEPLGKALNASLSQIHDDLSVAVGCAHGWKNLGERQYAADGYAAVVGQRPIFFENEKFRQHRHAHLRDIIDQDSAVYGLVNGTCVNFSCEGCKGLDSCT